MIRSAAALVVLALTRAALGNVAAAPVSSRIESPTTATGTPIEVSRERIRLECRAEGSQLTCALDVRYAIHNPTPVRQEVVAAFQTFVASVEAVTLDGVDVRSNLSPEETRALQDRVRRVDPDRPPPGLGTGMRIGIEAGRSAELRVRGSIPAEDLRYRPGYAVPAATARHPLFGTGDGGNGQAYRIDYYLAPIRTWAGSPELEVEVVVPEGYRGGGKRAFARGAMPETLSIVIERPGPVLVHGGPRMAIGGTFGEGVRLSAGWEVARPDWAIYSLAFETNARDRHYVVPMAMVATDSVFVIIPSIGLGLGAPVQIVPDLEVGGRLLVDAHFAPLGLVAALDAYPGSGNLQISLLGQLGL